MDVGVCVNVGVILRVSKYWLVILRLLLLHKFYYNDCWYDKQKDYWPFEYCLYKISLVLSLMPILFPF